MTDDSWLGTRFEASRSRLLAVAYRMLGTRVEAEDAVQESWLRLQAGGHEEIGNLEGWLTTVVSRVCLDRLRARRARPEDPAGGQLPDALIGYSEEPDPAQEALLAESVGSALLIVLETLTPAERVSFVLHDIFAVPFDEIAPIVERSPEATRQIASRARRRIQGTEAAPVDLRRHREIIDAFLAASRSGDFEALLTLLDPDVRLSSDATALQHGAPGPKRGPKEVASECAGRARGAEAADVEGRPALAWAPGGRVRVVFNFEIKDDRIVDIELIADPDRLAGLEVQLLQR